MTFALIVLVVLAIPIWLARQGYSRIKIGLCILGTAMLSIPIFLKAPGAWSALLVWFSIPFGLIGVVWTVVAVIDATKAKPPA